MGEGLIVTDSLTVIALIVLETGLLKITQGKCGFQILDAPVKSPNNSFKRKGCK